MGEYEVHLEISIPVDTIRWKRSIGRAESMYYECLSRSQISAVVVGALKLFRTPAALALQMLVLVHARRSERPADASSHVLGAV